MSDPPLIVREMSYGLKNKEVQGPRADEIFTLAWVSFVIFGRINF